MASIPFELSNHQKFVKNFLSSQTPYNSLLLFHGLGTGKTCSAISICEEMRTFYMNSNIKKSIYIVASANIQENFRIQLFNPYNLIKTDGIWKMKANCVGSSLLLEAYPIQPPNLSKKTIVNKINGIINLTYTFVGYIQFSNYIESMFKNASNEQGIRLLKREFDNKMLVIDEAHNIRSSENMDSKKVSRTMRLFIKSVNNLKLVLLTATPMFNSSKEIVELLNLLNLNEKRALITNKNVFGSDGKLSEEGKEQIINKSRGVVSFIRGDNPYTFPLRIYPTLFSKSNTFLEHTYPEYQLNGSKVPHHDNYILNTLYLNTLEPYQLNIYQSIVSSLLKSLNDYESDSESETQETQETQETVVESKKLSYSLLLPLIESLFIVYPPDISNPDDTLLLYGKRGFNRIMKHNKDMDAGYGTYSYNSLYNKEPMFRYDNIGKYSVKIKNILDSIYNPNTDTVSDGIVIIYCEFIESGIIPIALALEERGMTAYDKNASLLRNEGSDVNDDFKVLKKYKYITITGNQALSYNKSENIQLSSNIDNMNGDIIKVILISRAGSEGIDFKFIRQIHTTTPWYNMNRFEQINGRGVRNLSHKELPPDKRNVSIYLHASVLPDELNKETSDLYMYRFSENKAIEIGKIIRLLKENAVDCELNKEQFNFSKDNMYELNKNVTQTLSTGEILEDYRVGDEPYSSVCDYMKDCAYSCTSMSKSVDMVENANTYNTYYMESNKSQLINIIKDLFFKQYIYTDEELVNAIHNKNKS
ncbi:DEAD/DEAH box helicase, partial [Nitrosopumilus sp.]|nr:DEAD/DEAH box helicase [Nitrosopumilus sp.]